MKKNKITPYWRADYIIKKAILDGIQTCSNYITGIVLDIGCGNKPYEKLFTGAIKYFGLDIPVHYSANKEDKKADIYCNLIRSLPIKNACIDGVIATEILEHMINPTFFLEECSRIMKKDGCILITTPMTWEMHEIPFDYYRYTKFGLIKLLENSGFKIERIIPHSNSFLTVVQLYNLLIYNKFILNHPRFIRSVFSIIVFLISRISLFIFYNAKDAKLPLGYTVLAKKN